MNIRCKRVAIVPAFVVVLTMSACTDTEPTSDSGTHADAATTAQTPAQADASAAAVEPALELSGVDNVDTCMEPDASRNLAFFDVTWKANTDLNSIDFGLVNPVGVKQVAADTLNVPPKNFGGRIDYSGSASWKSRMRALNDEILMVSRAGDMWSESPIDGETGLAVMHIKFDATCWRHATARRSTASPAPT